MNMPWKFAVLIILVPNLGNQCKYVIHYRYLQLHLSFGINIVKINKILIFKRFKKHIHFKIDKTKSAANSFAKDFFKPTNNSTDKVMENLR